MTNSNTEVIDINGFAQMRIAAKLKQEDVADKLSTDRSTVAKWETGVAMPRADKLPAIAKLYGCSIEKLLATDSDEDGTELKAM